MAQRRWPGWDGGYNVVIVSLSPLLWVGDVRITALLQPADIGVYSQI